MQLLSISTAPLPSLTSVQELFYEKRVGSQCAGKNLGMPAEEDGLKADAYPHQNV